MKICIIGDSIAAAKQDNNHERTGLFRECLSEKFSKITSKIEFFEKVEPGVDTNVGKTWLASIPGNFDLYIICFGVNDAAKHHVISEIDYAKNMNYFSSYFQSPVFLVTPPTVNEIQTLPKRCNSDMRLYSNEIRKLQDKILIDLNLWMDLHYNSGYLRQLDGLHLSKDGYKLLSALIFDKYIGLMEES